MELAAFFTYSYLIIYYRPNLILYSRELINPFVTFRFVSLLNQDKNPVLMKCIGQLENRLSQEARDPLVRGIRVRQCNH